MGGSDPFFEEAKVSSDGLLTHIDIAHSMFVEHPVYCCLAVGTLIFVMLASAFLQREHAFIASNPEIQWHLKHIKKDEEELKAYMHGRWKQKQT